MHHCAFMMLCIFLEKTALSLSWNVEDNWRLLLFQFRLYYLVYREINANCLVRWSRVLLD